jgi:tRNA-2-methylthio-N6-dimethylallyladenosine synthase
VPASGLDDADLVIVNTCCVRDKAEQKFYSLMGRLERIKRRKGTILGVTGCIAQLEKERIADKLPFIDFSLGPSSISLVGEALARRPGSRPFFGFSENGYTGSLSLEAANGGDGFKAFVTIMKGCSNFCSYCVVPFVRGKEVSRESSAVVKEVMALAGSGVKEVTLLGQNVNSYNRDTSDLSFPELLRQINGVDGIERIRFVTSHPKDLSEDLIRCFGELEKLCEQIHLPFQSGSDRILALMNRGYSKLEYRKKIEGLRERCGGVAISADCIVGFPGEDENAFEETLELVKEVEFDGMFSFAYSPRRHTDALNLPGEVPRDVALRRLIHLQNVQKGITLKKNRALEGTVAEVLVEGVSKHSESEVTGRTRTNRIVNFPGESTLIGRTVPVRIAEGYANSLKGERLL